ncbi:MAG: hypothetical protein Q9170_000445 [Blastenia crenularia]
MALSKKELRKISKTLRRSGCRSNVSPLSGLSQAQGTETVSVSAFAGHCIKLHQIHRHPGTARSLSEAFANVAVQTTRVPSKRRQHVSYDPTTFSATAPRRLVLGHCPDPFVDGGKRPVADGDHAISKLDGAPDHYPASVEDNLDTASAGSTSPSRTSVEGVISGRPQEPLYWHSKSVSNPVQPPSRFVETRLPIHIASPALHTSKSKLSEKQQEPSLNFQLKSDGTHGSNIRQRTEPINFRPTLNELPHDEARRIQESFKKFKEPNQRTTLTTMEQTDRTERWIEQTPYAGSIGFTASRNPKAALRAASEPADLQIQSPPFTVSTIEAEASEKIDAFSENQSQATTLINVSQPTDRLLADMGRSSVGPQEFGDMTHDLIRHPQEPPWGYHPRKLYPWGNSPLSYPSAQKSFALDRQGTTPGLYDNIHGPMRRQREPIVRPMNLSQLRTLPPSDPRHRDEPAFYESCLDACRRMRHPDWTKDARHRPDIPKPPEEYESTRLMDKYTQRFYGDSLDAVRDLHCVERPRGEANLGGLLP